MSFLIATAKSSLNVVSSYAWTELSSKDFLLQHHRGAYTTGRTVGFGMVLEWDMQLDRLERSIQRLCPTNNNNQNEPWTASNITCFLRDSLIQFYNKFPLHPKTYDIRLTLLFSDEPSDVGSQTLGFCHLGVLPEPPFCCDVEIVKFKARSEANVKDSEWIRERQVLEKTMRPSLNEIILQDSTGNLYEGLSSNFFILEKANSNETFQDYKIVTAPKETILPGTIMRVIEEISMDPHVDPLFPRLIEYKFPNVADIDRWEGAFISSTSRLLLPIREIFYMDGNIRSSRKFPESNLTFSLPSILQSELPKYATNIIKE